MRKYFTVAFLVCATGILFAEPAKEANDSRQLDDGYVRIKGSLDYESSDFMVNIKKMYSEIDKLSTQKKYQQALKICNKIERNSLARYKKYKEALSAVSLAKVYLVESRVYSSMDDFAQAVEYIRKAVHLYERHPYLIQSKQYSRLKSLLEQREKELDDINYAKSIKQAKKLYDSNKYDAVEKVLKGLINQELQIKPLHNKRLAHLYFLSGRNLIMLRDKSALGPLEKSLYYFSQIKKDKKQFFDDYLTYDIYMFLSFACKLNNQPERSLQYAKVSYETVRKQGKINSNALIATTIALGHAYRACNDNKNAVKYAKKALELMKKDPTLKSRLHLVENSIEEWSK